MKIFYICLLVVILVIDKSLSGPAVKCYDKATDHYWPAGQEYRPIGQCVTIRCSAQGQRSALTCAVPSAANQGCTKIPADLRRTYPECCPKYKCTR